MTYGYLRAKTCFKVSYTTEKIIIQITTIGNYSIVNKHVETIRSYQLPFPHEIWIVTEPMDVKNFKGTDRVVVVPSEFKSIAKNKARALDYAAETRKKMGIISDKIKILYIDDDAIPSRSYVERCFFGDYDIMEGIIQPKLNYGTRYSYVENMRTLACMSVCSVYQAHGHPVWVHGEGICVRASTEQTIGWKFDVIASEDLVFGHTCSSRKLKWGFVWDVVYITSPWTFRDFFRQRHRWLWGNVNAIKNILTWKSKIRMMIFYVIGSSSLWISFSGILMDSVGLLNFPGYLRVLEFVSLGTWFGIYGFVGYKVGNGKAVHIILSICLTFYTSIMNTFPIWIGLFFKRPQRFHVISKEKVI